MAYFSSDLRDAFEERRHGIQGDARADAAFLSAIHVGHLCSGDYARQARCASGGSVADVSSRVERRTRFRFGGERDLTRSTGGKRQGGGHRWGAKVCPFAPRCVLGNSRKACVLNGRPVGTRTPDLYRVKVAL